MYSSRWLDSGPRGGAPTDAAAGDSSSSLSWLARPALVPGGPDQARPLLPRGERNKLWPSLRHSSSALHSGGCDLAPSRFWRNRSAVASSSVPVDSDLRMPAASSNVLGIADLRETTGTLDALFALHAADCTTRAVETSEAAAPTIRKEQAPRIKNGDTRDGCGTLGVIHNPGKVADHSGCAGSGARGRLSLKKRPCDREY